MPLTATARLALLFTVCQALCWNADIPTAQYDNARSMAQPLYLRNVVVSGQTIDVVYVATMQNTAYAFDADHPAEQTTIWPVTPDAADAIAGWVGGLGVLSTPVIVRSLSALYVVAATREAGVRVYRLHAVDLLNGAEKFGTAISGVNGGGTPVDFQPVGLGASDIDIAKVDLLDSNLNDIAFATRDSGVSVTPEPSAAALLLSSLLWALWARRRNGASPAMLTESIPPG